jgi:hypothetical protein
MLLSGLLQPRDLIFQSISQPIKGPKTFDSSQRRFNHHQGRSHPSLFLRQTFSFSVAVRAIPRGGRRHSAMTIEEEREFLSQWIETATTGGILTVPPIHAALVKRLGRDIPMSTTYRLLARHGWRKVQPDTKHPKSDPALQDEFKKNFLKRWQPPV